MAVAVRRVDGDDVDTRVKLILRRDEEAPARLRVEPVIFKITEITEIQGSRDGPVVRDRIDITALVPRTP